jgi:hypothetical protein
MLLCVEKIKASVNPNTFYALMDANRPIDILFFGNTNRHRQAVYADFLKLGKKHNLNIQFHMTYGLFGSHLDLQINRAKVNADHDDVINFGI